MDKKLKKIQKKSGTMPYIVTIALMVINTLNVSRNYSENQLVFLFGIVLAITIVNEIVDYYGELIINENSLLNHIPMTRFEVAKNYIYSLTKSEVITALFLGWFLIDIRDGLFKLNIIYGAIFIGIILFTINNLTLNILNLFEFKMKKFILNFDNKIKNMITAIIVLFQALVFSLVYYLAIKIPIIVETSSGELVNPENFMAVKYNYIRSKMFFSIHNESYINLTFLLIILLIDIIVLISINFYKRRHEYGN